ncbi:zinc-ribbon domain-containing protein [Roseovarius rhodophyticola]|uniref:Zinc-ribbon domain-containing protein n=1 Tax=Roseovarius rhodophyticola TaxID=3080827 RepID=A0ABZ2TIV9_9RHOB|nr:zinc-ribbon domain-containing protein [Roseovarius sp. W115]MDV2929851.1 zinc-ribbon domain-containing protein [Roseovarius sp. W115]
MRLICPNCGAQYEVPDEVIPTSGRDVQCSDCGNTWFQHHPDHQPEPEEEDVAADWVEDAEEDASEAQASVADEPKDVSNQDTQDDDAEESVSDVDRMVEAHGEAAEDFEEDYADDNADEEPVEEPQPPSAVFPRQLDPSVAEVLREEAELETSARASDQQGGLETQQELGLDAQDSAAQQRSEEARSRMARLRGDDVADPATEGGTEEIEVDSALDDQASRRNLLPDIDEINSSLGPENAGEASSAISDQPVPVAARKSGFRTGFRLAVILALIGLLVYIFAPQLAEAVPALSEPLMQYQNMVDGWRSGLDGVIKNFASSLSDQ